VQLVFPRVTADNAALKLTIAQYLTPGDVSIQGVGVAPDIELDPMTADTIEMDLYRSERSFRERDLTKSLTGAARRSTDQPFFRLRYNMPETERAAIRDRGGEMEDEFQLDFPIEVGRDIVLKSQPGKRGDQLRELKPFLEKLQQSELEEVSQDLKKLGIDWSAPPKDYPGGVKSSDFEVKAETDRTGDTVTAGETMTLKVSVKNKGTAPIYQLRAITKSDGPYYDERELVFGRVNPGETRTATVPFGFCEVDGKKPGSTRPVPSGAPRVCRIPLDADPRADSVMVRFFAEAAEPPRDAELRPTVHGLPQPIFAYTYQIVDNRPGNGDGQLARGEGATVYLTVKNVGKGAAFESQANLRNLTGDGLLLHAGRFDVSGLKPNEVRSVAFTFDVLDVLPEGPISIEISVVDRDLRVVSSEKLKIPVARSPLVLQPASGKVAATAVVPVRGQPLGAAPVVAELEKGSVVERLGTFGPYTKLGLGADRFGFAESRLLKDATGAVKPLLRPLLSHSPPLLEVKPAKLATREGRVRIEGNAADADRVMDAVVFVGSRKVFYQSNKKAADPTKLKFSFDAELQPGINVITVVARENADTTSRVTMVVRRDGPNGEALPTPKADTLEEDWEIGSD
ncbi:MAG: peptidase S41, partial [Myxococcota bacterium]|nr:peptidase S41 [Myxococcota bacterium]